ncbi:uncharacterized protein Cipc isoform X2 [Procambarus clarkii]|uniref:uncharacterized protein Cipc isoform X2 n=1 Tax=Procambarus clarkii TaxID=6728 RepID=UPI001E676E79|nr:uncharacterized protein LOC123766155 isoform X2 [Procambarus clarkii]
MNPPLLRGSEYTPRLCVQCSSCLNHHGIKRHFSELFPNCPSPRNPEIPQDSRSPEKRKTAHAPLSDSSSDSEQDEIAKRMCLGSRVLPDTDTETTTSIKESCASRRRRFMRTAEALRQSGLLDITMKTAELLRKNQKLQREIENLQKETRSFVLSVLSNPENRHILDNIHSGVQLYEVVVPGSQRIMSVSTHPADVNMNSTSLTLSNDMSNDSISSHSNVSSTSPPSPTVSSSSDTASFSDIELSEEENLSPPNIFPNSGH